MSHAGGSPTDGGLVLLGEFGRAKGLRGEVRLKSHTGDPLAIAGYGPLLTPDGRAVVLSQVRRAAGEAADMLVARVAGVATREAAEALNRVRLFIAREKLPAPEDEDEFLLADLIGMAAEDPAGRSLGTVRDVPNFGGGELIEIAPTDGGETLLLPFTRACVPVVDVARRRIVVALPAEAGPVETGPVEAKPTEAGALDAEPDEPAP